MVGGKCGIIFSPNRFSGFSGEETVETIWRRGHDVMVTLIKQGVDATFLKKCQVVSMNKFFSVRAQKRRDAEGLFLGFSASLRLCAKNV